MAINSPRRIAWLSPRLLPGVITTSLTSERLSSGTSPSPWRDGAPRYSDARPAESAGRATDRSTFRCHRPDEALAFHFRRHLRDQSILQCFRDPVEPLVDGRDLILESVNLEVRCGVHDTDWRATA